MAAQVQLSSPCSCFLCGCWPVHLAARLLAPQVCQRHIGDLSECGVRLSAAFTALSTLIRPPKSKKKRWWQVWKKGEQSSKGRKSSKAAAADSRRSAAADAAAATAAALDREQQRRTSAKLAAAAAADGQQQQQQQQQAQHGGPDSEGDDPFADLANGRTGGRMDNMAPLRRPSSLCWMRGARACVG